LECNKDYSNLQNLTIKYMQELGKKYPFAGYGFKFSKWLMTPAPQPYNSFGNGSAMRVSAIPLISNSLDEVKLLSKLVTEVTHNHTEGIKGAEATAVCMYMALNGCSKEEIKKESQKYYDLDFDYNDLLRNYRFDETCQGSVPQSIYAFLISTSYEDTLRTAISMGGDADTMACIAGSIAGAYYGVPEEMLSRAKGFLTNELEKIANDFDSSINK